MESKHRHHPDALKPDDPAQNTLAEIHPCTRDAVIDLRDLGNIVSRLETCVRHARSR